MNNELIERVKIWLAYRRKTRRLIKNSYALASYVRRHGFKVYYKDITDALETILAEERGIVQ